MPRSRRRTVQIGVRLTQEELDEVDRIVQKTNEHCREMGLPIETNRSSIIRMWIRRSLDVDVDVDLSRTQARLAPNVAASTKKLKESRK